MAYEHILYDTAEHVARVTLNVPDKLNPLSAEMLGELSHAFAAARDDADVRAIVLTGAGRAFSAGADLRAVSPGRDLGVSLERGYNPLVAAMRALPKPILASVNGVCAGAACGIALACDIVVAARSASFIEVFARIALLPDAGNTYFLPRAIGTPRALAASLLADDIGAEQAHAWGMIWQVVDDAALTETVAVLAGRLARGPSATYGLIKRAIYAGGERSLADQLQFEADLQRRAGFTADHAEGVAAFKEKRAARFTGT